MNTREQFTPELWEYVENAVANGEVQIVENQSYKAHTQKGSDLIEQGVTEIYNNLEDAHEPVKADGYVITGTAGEQWCIKEKNLPKYGVTADEIPPEGMDVMTQPDGKIMIAIPTSKEMQGAVETDWASLKLNAPETQDGQPIPHGDGDYILIPTVFNKETKTVEIDRECGDARVVNGSIMDVLYQEIEPEVLKIPAIIEAIEQEQSALAQLQHLEKLGEQVNELKNGMDELGERIDKLGENLEEWKKQNEETAEKPLHIEIIDNVPDNPQIMSENGESFLNYYIAADDRTLEELCERTCFFEESGLESFDELVNSDSYVDMYVNAYQDGSMNVCLTYGGSEYNVPMKEDELELLEYKMKKIGMDVQKDLETYHDELSEIRSEKDSFVKD